MSEDEEYAIFLEIMFNVFSADEMAYAAVTQRNEIEREGVNE
jgi:hypothetical protein